MSSAARRAAEPHQRAKQSDELQEATEKCNDALVNVLKQACSRNRALERKALWGQKEKEDHGSRSSLTLKSNRGVTKTVHLVPKGAEVTKTSVNKFEEERQKMAEAKEDALLSRFCDGKDNAWRPDSFFVEACGDGSGEAKSKKNKKADGKTKKEKKGKDKKSKKSKKDKKGKKDKKATSKKNKNKKKDRKEKQAGRKGGAKRSRGSSDEDASSEAGPVEVGSDDRPQDGAPGRSRSSSSSSAAGSCSADFGGAPSSPG
ncbi:unnamed protein product [Prorocentrum cordatum]|uniref:Uncharacterized protein n=1 Tax=Prorocentrum cordatum TaxID=2364126 RepID=A0ABN9W779_9DINO|nr:unnamed protein product [Polarella glacialis]